MTLVKEDGVIKGATVASIIEWMVKENPDVTTLDHFFSSFPQFMTATAVWEQINRYVHSLSDDDLKDSLPSYVFATVVPVTQTESQTLTLSSAGSREGSSSNLQATYQQAQRPKTTRESIFNFLYAWIERSFYRDFLQTKKKQDKLFESLLRLLATLNNDTANRFKLLMIRAAHERKRRSRLIKLRSGAGTPVTPRVNQPAPVAPSLSSLGMGTMMRDMQLGGSNPNTPTKTPERKVILEPGKFEFLDLDPIDVAQQLTIIEFDIFRNISESELYHLAWRNDNPKRLRLAPNVVKLVERFNNVSYWVATEIVMVTTLRERVQVLRKFIQVAEHLAQLSNYNGVMEVIGGINMWAVTRLKSTWEQLPPRAHTVVEELNVLMESKSNYKNYRIALKKSPLPLMPYLGVYLRDLTFIEENKDYYGDDKSSGLFNFEKLQLLGQVITELKRFQTSDYMFERNEVLQEYLTKLLTLPEEMLIKHSQLCEPNTRDSH